MDVKHLKVGKYYSILVNGKRQIATFVRLNPLNYWGGRLTLKTDNQLIMGDKSKLKPLKHNN